MRFAIPPSSPVSIPIVDSDELFAVRRVYCVGRNYVEHAQEMGFSGREAPFFFCKPADAVVPVPEGRTGTIPYPSATADLQYEVELVVAMGVRAVAVSRDDALDHVFGYLIGLDMTRRDRQMEMRKQGRPWEVGKAFDCSAPVGPLHRRATVSGVDRAAIRLSVNGETKQSSNLANLIWTVSEVIAELSGLFELMPGDLIFTGTPAGVGPVDTGDLMVGTIGGLGELNLRVAARRS